MINTGLILTEQRYSTMRKKAVADIEESRAASANKAEERRSYVRSEAKVSSKLTD